MVRLRKKNRQLHRAASIIEVLVVVAIIGLLVAILLPAVQGSREAARRSSCTNNVRQISLAVELHSNSLTYYPASFRSPNSADMDEGAVDGWSAHVMILPFLDESVTQDRINLNRTFDENFAPIVNVKDGSKPISAIRVPVYLCPSEVRDAVRLEDGSPRHYPLNYGVNLGKWFVFDPANGRGGSGSFYPNSQLKAQHFQDGLSKTMMVSEVRAWQPYYRNAARDGTLQLPATAATLCEYGGAEFKTESGHTEWVDGRSHQAGFTTVFAPNSKVECEESGVGYDIDWTNQQEGKSPTTKTFASVTSRSYHPGVVMVGMMDGSSRVVNDDVDLSVWRETSTRSGGD